MGLLARDGGREIAAGRRRFLNRLGIPLDAEADQALTGLLDRTARRRSSRSTARWQAFRVRRTSRAPAQPLPSTGCAGIDESYPDDRPGSRRFGRSSTGSG